MRQNYLRNRISLFLLIFPCLIFAQNTITGTVTTDSGDTLAFANVVEKGTSNGTTTDIDGNFTIDVASLPATLVISSVGFATQEVTASGGTVSVVMVEGDALDEVVIVGSRGRPRTVLTSPVPIDNIGATELVLTGQPTVDKMLTYKVPSFNSTNQTISDATAHFDPADLRGLGPSRTLVLVNGKRKNQSALVYINDTPGKGEVGVDLKSIPAAAIKRVEVLRDGASAQYGSDAIAGVINMVLNEDVGRTVVNLTSGITTEGDGFTFGADVNTGLALGDNGGYLNLTFAYYQQEETDRAGTPGEDVLFGIAADDPDWAPWLRDNPDLGMTVGQPQIQKGDVFYNFGLPFCEGNAKLYSFGGLTYREGKSFALFRAPYWIPDPFNLLHEEGTEYNGFQPTFETFIKDTGQTIGVEFDAWGFDVDVSGTFGSNAVDYQVNNSLNPALGAASPTEFDPGGYSFSNILANLDISRSFGDVSVAIGGEVKEERFRAREGEAASYIGGGVQSFPGLQPQNAVTALRQNYGVYGDVEWEATDEFLIGGAVRYEDFSDFGDNTSWKVNGRYILGDNRGAIRASYSTGFRAPALHQIYLSNIQTLISGGTVSNQGTFNNVDPIIREGLGVPQLTAETSDNITAGITFKVTNDFSVSADFYNVQVDDRVLFTGEIGFDGDDMSVNPVEQILMDNSITSLKFFVNAVNTNTTGVDLVATYNNIPLAGGTLGITLAGNYNETDIDGQIDTPQLLADNGYEIFNRKEQSRITTSRPRTKVLAGLDFKAGKWNVIVNNTYFGEVTWQHFDNGLNGVDLGNGPLPTDDAAFDQTFGGKVLTDLIVEYAFTENLKANVSASNLFNVFPDEIETQGDFVTDLGGRFRYPWEVNQFGFLGTVINGRVTFSF